VHGVVAVRPHLVRPRDPAARNARPAAVTWPKAADLTLRLARPARGARRGAVVRASGAPVSAQALAGGRGDYTGPGRVEVSVAGRSAAGALGTGPVLAVRIPGGGHGAVRIGLDYSGFKDAYGGDYGYRLRLVALPACALTTPQVAACRKRIPVPSRNDPATRTVSADLAVSAGSAAPTVLAATSDPGQQGGAAGTYAATTLKPSGSWVSGASSGSFTYTYPIAVPPAASALVPAVALGYDSGSVDGQTSSTQAQSSWVGDGWTTPRSFIEQSFTSCADNPEGSPSPVSTTDLCYDGPVLTMSLNGRTTALVWDSGKGIWKPQHDDGSTVTHVTGANNGTGTYNTDYWKVTTRDGTTYTFGRNRLPGWASGRSATNSVDTEPVYSAHSGDPCYHINGTDFAHSVCTMAYRWNLDYVTDVNGNAMAYYYKQDTNFYGEDNGAHNVSYVRDSYLDHIDYGFTDGGAYGTVPDRVVFATGDRCLSGTCDPLNASTKANWKDVPYDLVCPAGTTCQEWGPSYFSTVRLTSITSQQWSVAAGAYQNVDSYALTQTMPATGDGTSPTLWLSSVAHTGSGTPGGQSTTAITLPAVSFTGVDLPNRVDTVTDGLPALYRYRIATITTETGSVIAPTYTLVAPCSAPVSIDPAANTSSCYPVYWTPAGYFAPFLDWFNRYAVTRVTATDPTGGAPATSTSYQYLGGAAWHFDDNELVKPKYRTYGQFRGYGEVQTRTGDGNNDPYTLTDTAYYRGMGATLTDSLGGHHADADPLAGQALETRQYLGDGGPLDHTTITSYWVSAATATRARTGLPDLTANWAAPAEVFQRQARTGAGPTTWRDTETDNSYDATVGSPTIGLLQRTYSHTVPADSAYDRCTANTYAAVNSGVNLVGLIAETETDSVACGGFTEGSSASAPAALNTLSAPAAVDRPAQVVSDVRTYYDDPAFSTTFPQPSPPSRGEQTMTRSAASWSSGAFTYQTTRRTAYDSYGRITASYDGNGNKTTTGYTMDSAGLTTAMTVTNPLGQVTSTTLDPQRALPLTQTDANGITTTHQYDSLGRATALWLDGRATTAAANYTYAYQVSSTGVTAVTTRRLNDESGYQTSTLIYDAQLRPRQTQTDTPMSGRMVTDTFYDSHGWKIITYNGWWDPATTPNTTLVSAADLKAQVPSQDFYTYDGLGRVVVDASAKDGVTEATTTTVHNGDRVTTVGPAGGLTQTTVTDPLGRTSQIDQYLTAPALNTPANTFSGVWSVSGGTTASTRYGYDGHGLQSTITDPQNNTWTSANDLLGNAVTKTGPDTGTTTLSYDADGNITQTTDARGKTLSYTYDSLDRKTGQYDAPAASQSSANQLASWVYDNSNNAVTGMRYPIGHLTTATALRGGAAYTVQQTNFNVFGLSLGQRVTIPAAEGALAGTYTINHVYSTTTGLLTKDVYPVAAGGLPAETVNHGYATALDLPDTLGGLTGYAQAVTYDAYGRVNQETIGAAPNLAYLTNTWDPRTGRLTDQLVTRAVATPSTVDEQAYTYDPAGNLTRQDSTRLGDSTLTETQCYQYDPLQRLTAAWTATDACRATPTAGDHSMVGDGLGAASMYWSTWQVDVLGDRTSQVQHGLGGGSDVSTTYTYDGNGAGQPHTLTAAGPASYRYDASGNMTTRTTAATGTQTLSWNDAGQLAAVTGGTAGDSSFVYDADGNLLLQKDPGVTTLYLPGEQLSLNTATNTVTGVRYYPLPGGGSVVRTGTATSAYTFAIGDPHDTPTLYLDNTAQNPAWRQYTPYGEPRATASPSPDNHGFLNKPQDTATALTEIGARNYDPGTGQFISADPLLNTGSPQELNPYAYATNNPTTNSDPTGLCMYRDGDLCISPGVEQGHIVTNGSGTDVTAGDSYVPPPLHCGQPGFVGPCLPPNQPNWNPPSCSPFCQPRPPVLAAAPAGPPPAPPAPYVPPPLPRVHCCTPGEVISILVPPVAVLSAIKKPAKTSIPKKDDPWYSWSPFLKKMGKNVINFTVYGCAAGVIASFLPSGSLGIVQGCLEGGTIGGGAAVPYTASTVVVDHFW
jgi:RHS repeat-associated protein